MISCNLGGMARLQHLKSARTRTSQRLFGSATTHHVPGSPHDIMGDCDQEASAVRRWRERDEVLARAG